MYYETFDTIYSHLGMYRHSKVDISDVCVLHIHACKICFGVFKRKTCKFNFFSFWILTSVECYFDRKILYDEVPYIKIGPKTKQNKNRKHQEEKKNDVRVYC